jgi:hypothetical protein
MKEGSVEARLCPSARRAFSLAAAGVFRTERLTAKRMALRMTETGHARLDERNAALGIYKI